MGQGKEGSWFTAHLSLGRDSHQLFTARCQASFCGVPKHSVNRDPGRRAMRQSTLGIHLCKVRAATRWNQLTPWGYKGLIQRWDQRYKNSVPYSNFPFSECSRKGKILQFKRVASERLPALLELSGSNSSRRWKMSGYNLSVSCLYSLLCFLS